jgi:hypothetical protein
MVVLEEYVNTYAPGFPDTRPQHFLAENASPCLLCKPGGVLIYYSRKQDKKSSYFFTQHFPRKCIRKLKICRRQNVGKPTLNDLCFGDDKYYFTKAN